MMVQIGNLSGRELTSVADIGPAITEMEEHLGRILSESELELYNCAYSDLKRRTSRKEA
jgi:hypothetical protein